MRNLWRVRYNVWNRRREIVRLFPTERRARAFYRRLTTRRRNFAVSMTIERLV